MNITHVRIERAWRDRDALDVLPLAAAFTQASNRAFANGNEELVRVKFAHTNKSVRREFDRFMQLVQKAAAEDMNLNISWERASVSPVASIRHAIIAPKR